MVESSAKDHGGGGGGASYNGLPGKPPSQRDIFFGVEVDKKYRQQIDAVAEVVNLIEINNKG